MVLISHSNKFIFIKTKKSASTSIEESLEYYLIGMPPSGFGEETPERISSECYVTGRGQVPKPNFMKPHISSRELNRLLGDERFASYLKATSVRNPWDQVVSFFWWQMRKYPYFHSVARGAPMIIVKLWFSIWFLTSRSKLKGLSFTHQLSLGGELPSLHLIRYESAEADIRGLLEKLGLSPGDLYIPSRKSHIRARPEPFEKYYFDFVRKSISKSRNKDLANFGYKWEPG
jgi:hypothetical protein